MRMMMKSAASGTLNMTISGVEVDLHDHPLSKCHFEDTVLAEVFDQHVAKCFRFCVG